MHRVLGLVLLFFALPAFTAETSTLEERMSKDEFRAAGLGKLSPAELKVLNDWLAGHQQVKTVKEVVTPTGKPVFETDQGERKIVETRISGRFSGWYGKTVFKLDNGQEWTQAESGQFSNGKYDNPKVRVKPMLLGSWLMYVEPCGCSVRVERTK
ncbi:hypothetical protein [Rudaea sp.]|uniref:hypothetical protein n=1 Tax=Rudaea sp. TaxID=2136325 RepID=UPI00321F7492